jgi:hypothetical protein
MTQVLSKTEDWGIRFMLLLVTIYRHICDIRKNTKVETAIEVQSLDLVWMACFKHVALFLHRKHKTVDYQLLVSIKYNSLNGRCFWWHTLFCMPLGISIRGLIVSVLNVWSWNLFEFNFYYKIFSLYIESKNVPHATINYICRLLIVHDVTRIYFWKINWSFPDFWFRRGRERDINSIQRKYCLSSWSCYIYTAI